MRLTLDSFAWIEIIRGTSLGSVAKGQVEGSDACFTPAIVLAEVAHRCRRDGLPGSRIEGELKAMCEASAVVPITPKLVSIAASVTEELRERATLRGLRPAGLADGLILASARGVHSQLLTGDPHFEGLTETRWIG